MNVTQLPLAAMRLIQVVKKDSQTESHELYEGEAPDMPPATQDSLKALIGDGNSKVTVSRQISESNFGSGGHVFVSITLTCDQSEAGVNGAVGWAAHLAENYAFQQLPALRDKLTKAGIIASQ